MMRMMRMRMNNQKLPCVKPDVPQAFQECSAVASAMVAQWRPQWRRLSNQIPKSFGQLTTRRHSIKLRQ